MNRIYLFVLIVPMSAISAVPQLVFDTFNQSVNAGADVAQGVYYQQQPSYQLVEGDKPASQTGWRSHSTLTTGLFSLAAGKKVQLSYVVKADVKDDQQPVLWTEIRYFDQYGVNVDIKGGQRRFVSSEWRRYLIDLSPAQMNIAYAEVWFVKYENGQSGVNKECIQEEDDIDSNAYISVIYLSDIKL